MGIFDIFRRAQAGDPDPVSTVPVAPVAQGAARPLTINGSVSRERCEGRIARLREKLARQLDSNADDDAIEETERSIRHYQARLTMLETQG
jgi:hypothetical protein